MDVRLPDGTVIQNVPDNITKAELDEKLKANNINIEQPMNNLNNLNKTKLVAL